MGLAYIELVILPCVFKRMNASLAQIVAILGVLVVTFSKLLRRQISLTLNRVQIVLISILVSDQFLHSEVIEDSGLFAARDHHVLTQWTADRMGHFRAVIGWARHVWLANISWFKVGVAEAADRLEVYRASIVVAAAHRDDWVADVHAWLCWIHSFFDCWLCNYLLQILIRSFNSSLRVSEILSQVFLPIMFLWRGSNRRLSLTVFHCLRFESFRIQMQIVLDLVLAKWLIYFRSLLI